MTGSCIGLDRSDHVRLPHPAADGEALHLEVLGEQQRSAPARRNLPAHRSARHARQRAASIDWSSVPAPPISTTQSTPRPPVISSAFGPQASTSL